jgi:copper chaperone
VAPEASVLCDVPTHTVTISGAHDAQQVEQAIKTAGYTPIKKV